MYYSSQSNEPGEKGERENKGELEKKIKYFFNSFLSISPFLFTYTITFFLIYSAILAAEIPKYSRIPSKSLIT